MMNALIALGLGIIIFALVVGVGIVVLTNFGTTVAQCPAGFTYQANGTVETCANNTDTTDTVDPTNTAWTTNDTLTGYLSTNLATWVPAIIALGVGLLFIGALMSRKAGNY